MHPSVYSSVLESINVRYFVHSIFRWKATVIQIAATPAETAEKTWRQWSQSLQLLENLVGTSILQLLLIEFLAIFCLENRILVLSPATLTCYVPELSQLVGSARDLTWLIILTVTMYWVRMQWFLKRREWSIDVFNSIHEDILSSWKAGLVWRKLTFFVLNNDKQTVVNNGNEANSVEWATPGRAGYKPDCIM